MEPHWLVRPATIRLLWRAFIALLALTVIAGFFVSHDHLGGPESRSPSARGSASAPARR